MSKKALGLLLVVLGVIALAGVPFFFAAGLFLGPLLLALGLYFLAAARFGRVPGLAKLALALLGLQGFFTILLVLIYKIGGYANLPEQARVIGPGIGPGPQLPPFLVLYYLWDNYGLAIGFALIILFFISMILARRKMPAEINPA